MYLIASSTLTLHALNAAAPEFLIIMQTSFMKPGPILLFVYLSYKQFLREKAISKYFI